MSEPQKPTSISFPRERGGRHPKSGVVIYRLEITEVPGAPLAADASICRFKPADASLTRDASGVTLKWAGDEYFWGFGRLDEVVNVPRAK